MLNEQAQALLNATSYTVEFERAVKQIVDDLHVALDRYPQTKDTFQKEIPPKIGILWSEDQLEEEELENLLNILRKLTQTVSQIIEYVSG